MMMSGLMMLAGYWEKLDALLWWHLRKCPTRTVVETLRDYFQQTTTSNNHDCNDDDDDDDDDVVDVDVNDYKERLKLCNDYKLTIVCVDILLGAMYF